MVPSQCQKHDFEAWFLIDLQDFLLGHPKLSPIMQHVQSQFATQRQHKNVLKQVSFWSPNAFSNHIYPWLQLAPPKLRIQFFVALLQHKICGSQAYRHQITDPPFCGTATAQKPQSQYFPRFFTLGHAKLAITKFTHKSIALWCCHSPKTWIQSMHPPDSYMLDCHQQITDNIHGSLMTIKSRGPPFSQQSWFKNIKSTRASGILHGLHRNSGNRTSPPCPQNGSQKNTDPNLYGTALKQALH